MPINEELISWTHQSTDRDTKSTSQAVVNRFIGDQAHTTTDTLAIEEPLELQFAYGPVGSRQVKSISVTMRTPGYNFELVAGFLMTEGIVSDPADISDRILCCPAGSSFERLQKALMSGIRKLRINGSSIQLRLLRSKVSTFVGT